MATLNGAASEAMVEVGVAAATDVTGFGLLGHLRTMMRASGVAAELQADAVPILDGVRALAEAGHVPGGTRRNLDDLAADLDFSESVEALTRTILADAQTSGGLLMCVAPGQLDRLIERLDSVGVGAAIVGEVVEGDPGRIRVT